MIVRGRDLDHVHSDQFRSQADISDGSQEVGRLHSARLRRPGSGGEAVAPDGGGEGFRAELENSFLFSILLKFHLPYGFSAVRVSNAAPRLAKDVAPLPTTPVRNTRYNLRPWAKIQNLSD